MKTRGKKRIKEETWLKQESRRSPHFDRMSCFIHESCKYEMQHFLALLSSVLSLLRGPEARAAARLGKENLFKKLVIDAVLRTKREAATVD